MIEAMKQALEFLEDNQELVADNERHLYVMGYNDFIEKLRQAIAEAEKQEPVCTMCKSTHGKWSWICGNCLLIHDKQSTAHGIKEKNNG